MSTAERLQQLLSYLGVNAKAFSEMCGYERPQVIYDLLKGKTRNFSAAMTNRIIEAVPSVNRTWLLTGDGQMISANTEQIPEPTVKIVPLLPMSALAGPIKGYFEPGVNLAQCRRIVSPTEHADFAMPVIGDSMEPSFPDRGIVFIKRINESAFIPWGHTLVIDTENGVFIKNVFPDETNDEFIWAESLNPKYPRMHIPKSSIQSMYRVLTIQKDVTSL